MVTPNTKYGKQPIHDVLHALGHGSFTKCAISIGVSYASLRQAVTGRCRPNSVMREKLPRYLHTPLEKLFTERALKEGKP